MLNRSAASGCEDESMPEQSPLLSVGTKRRGTDPPPELCESLDDSEGAPKRRQGEPWQYEVTNPLCVQTEKEIKTELYDEDNAELNVKKENDLYEDYPDKFEDNFDPYEELFSCIMKATDPFEENRLLHREFQLLPSKKIYPDYYHMIEHPIDLKLIEQKIQTSAYESLNEIEKDLLQMTRNARIFNEPDSQIYKDAENLAKLIAAKMLEIGSGRAGTTVFKKSELMMSTMAASLKAEPDSSNDESENSKKSGGDGPLWQLFNQLYNAASESDITTHAPTSATAAVKWTDALTEKLIELRGKTFKHLFSRQYFGTPAWEKIKKELGVNCDIRVISKKWSNLVNKYKTLKDSLSGLSTKEDVETVITWQFYDAMDEILRSSHVTKPLILVGSTGHVPDNARSTATEDPTPLSTSDLSLKSCPSASQKPGSSNSPQPGSISFARKWKALDAEKRDKYVKLILEQNNRMLVMFNSFVVARGGEGLGSDVEVPLSSSDEEE